ncbi:hypothetical protein [Leptospira gomenensis]|uniref:hypothetical protein n=1 Tax=Leptospira gomenensis TaxID=2484974 RepID=UPI001FE5FD2D|nr:hypothetical protein [Leptospira gomenensis]
MGLDMRPLGKPKPGYENEYIKIFNILQSREKQKINLIEKLLGKKENTFEQLLVIWNELQISPFETIKAPMVGRDFEANMWLNSLYETTDKSIEKEEFFQNYNGYYVIELAKELEGVPMYQSPVADANVFRGEFLRDCEDLIGEKLTSEAWISKLSHEALDYGNRLMDIADKLAIKHNLEYLKSIRIPPKSEGDSMDAKLHILFSLAKWLIFYGKNGHGYEADY